MSYKSPIDIIYGNIETKVEDDVVKAIQSYNISVDKDELIKALNYDREQYKAGYKDALQDAIIAIKDKYYEYAVAIDIVDIIAHLDDNLL